MGVTSFIVASSVVHPRNSTPLFPSILSLLTLL